MKTEMLSFARQYTALTRFAQRFPHLMTDDPKKAVILLGIEAIVPDDRLPTLIVYRHEAGKVFAAFGDRLLDWKVDSFDLGTRTSHILSRVIEGVKIRMSLESPDDEVLSLLKKEEPVTFANGGRRFHQAERSAK